MRPNLHEPLVNALTVLHCTFLSEKTTQFGANTHKHIISSQHQPPQVYFPPFYSLLLIRLRSKVSWFSEKAQSFSISGLFCLRTLFLFNIYYNSVLPYLDSSTFRVRSEGVSVVTVRHWITCHPLVHVLPTLSQNAFDNSAPFEIHLRKDKKKSLDSDKCNRVATLDS